MLRLRLEATVEQHGSLSVALGEIEGVRRLTASVEARDPDRRLVLMADVVPAAADQVVALLESQGVAAEDCVLEKVDLIYPHVPLGHAPDTEHGLLWVEVMGEARASSRPFARYLALMAVAGAIAGLGVLTANPILIVGAMAVSPDLLPICATCVGIVGRRPRLAKRALVTLLIGMGLIVATAAALSFLLNAGAVLAGDFDLAHQGLKTLSNVDYSTVIVAFVAGIAAMLAFETRASTAVGVAISVTTIPASAYLGAAIGLGESSEAGGAIAVLAVNVALLILSGSLTLVVQRRVGLRADTRVRRPG